MSRLIVPLKRGPWRYLGDRDVLHAAVVAVLAVVLTGGLVWVAYAAHVWRIARCSPVVPPGRMTLLVFGRRLVQDWPEHDYQQRLERALALIRQELAERVLLLGGCSGGRISEAAAGAAWLRQRGLPAGTDLQLEQASVDSLENLRHARSLLQESGPLSAGLPPVALVTNRYHLARCQWLARRLGFADCVPVAAEPELRLDRRYVLRLLLESGYMMWIDLALRWARLTGHRRIAARLS